MDDQRSVILRARGVKKTYRMGSTDLPVLRGVDLDVRQGEILAILGSSGCGKSTLLHVLGWLDQADEGEIHFEGQDRASLSNNDRAALRNQVMGFVFQFYHLMPELTALENVTMPARILHNGFGAWRKHAVACEQRAKDLMALVGLDHRMDHRPRFLSGGERQRVAIARALMNKPRFLFCDEPTGNLDGSTADEVRKLLWGLNEREGQTMVVVTHDARLAKQAHRVVRLDRGLIAEGGLENLVEEVELDA